MGVFETFIALFHVQPVVLYCVWSVHFRVVISTVVDHVPFVNKAVE